MSARSHHSSFHEAAADTWTVARPLRDTSRWHQWKAERSCRKATGHCWHPEGLIDWWCCMCSAATEGMPPQACIYCKATS